jgi:hypothetical protein
MRVFLLVMVAAGACVSGAWVASAKESPDPRKSAKSLIAGLRPKKVCNFGAGKVTSRHGRVVGRL